MNLIKCPRCDLNYILDTEKYCKVCLREMKGSHVEDELEMCSVCNEAPALPGHDVCLSCLKEMNGHTSDDDVEGGTVVDESSLGLNSVSNMDEIIPQMNDDDDFSDLEGDLSLESVIEDEENSEDEDEDDE